MVQTITAQPLTRENFAEFGEVIELGGDNHFSINNGNGERYHALAAADVTGPNARVLISIVSSKEYAVPLKVPMVERHPFGSQAFIPMSPGSFILVVCPDDGNGPGAPRAFFTKPGQGVNYSRNLWHGILTPIGKPQNFIVVDRGGDGNNLEEFFFPEPYEIHLPIHYQAQISGGEE